VYVENSYILAAKIEVIIIIIIIIIISGGVQGCNTVGL
jgi:hypothetical protein